MQSLHFVRLGLLFAVHLTAYAGNPLTAADIQTEQRLYTKELCWKKVELAQLTEQIHRHQLTPLALRGSSAIETKLSSCTVDLQSEPTIQGEPLPKIITDSARALPSRTATWHSGMVKLPAAYQGRIYMNGEGIERPETRFTADDLKNGALVLRPKGVIQVPAILDPSEVTDYLKTRGEQKLPPGSYYRLLHETGTPIEQLIKLRYYDYGDAHPARRNIPIYEASYYTPQTPNHP